MSQLRVGVNLCRIDPSDLDHADHAVLDTLSAIADEPPDDLQLVVFTSRALAKARPELVEALETHAFPFPPSWAALRVAVEHSWLRVALGRSRLDFLHDAGGTTPGVVDVVRLLSVHDLTPLERARGLARLRGAYHRRLVPRSLDQAARVIVPSGSVRDRLVQTLHADPSSISIVPWPLPPHAEAAPIENLRARHGIIGKIVLLAGSARPREEHLVAVRAMRHLAARHKETTLVLMGGEGPADPQVLDTIRELGLGERVVRFGAASEAVRSALLEHAAVVVYPSVYDSFAHPVLEAMACGVPVVVADAGAAPELVADAGGVVPYGDDAQLAVEVHRVLEDPEWRRERVAAGLERARGYTPRRAAEELLAAYRSVTAAL
jgi:glycosyltransferase involved in cell wall biosynthesis